MSFEKLVTFETAVEELLHSGMSILEIRDRLSDIEDDFNHWNLERDEDDVLR